MLYFSLLHLYGTNDWGMEVIIMREMLSVILNGCEGSVLVVRKAVSCHQSNRFFTPCHYPISCFSHKAFLPRSE